MTFAAYLADNARRHQELPRAPQFLWADTVQRRAEQAWELVRRPALVARAATMAAGVALLLAGLWLEERSGDR